jgi:predicted RNase H-like HicB family nuclease
MKYRAVYSREADGRWTVEIPQVRGCQSYGRTIAQARERIREALGLFVEDVGKAGIVDDVELPKHVQKRVAGAVEKRLIAQREEMAMLSAQRQAVLALRRKLKLGQRDAGNL